MPGIDKGIDFFIHVYFLSAIKRMSDHRSRILPDLCWLICVYVINNNNNNNNNKLILA